MIMVTTNISDVLQERLTAFLEFRAGDMLRAVSLSMLPVVRDRIHVRGEDASGGQIGTYNPDYLKRRIKKGKGSDPKVILSFDRHLQNDFTVVAEEGKGYGLGFHNDTQYELSQILEKEKYKKPIWSLQIREQDLAVETAKEFVIDALLK